MDYDSKKFIRVIGFVIFIVFIIVLFIIIDLTGDNNNKLFKQFDYVYENKSDYVSDYISGIPQVNILSDDVNRVNSLIISNYYDVVTLDYSSYSYSYGVFNNLLSLVIETNVYDDSEYGSISYYGYYFDLDNGILLDEDEFLERINVSIDSIGYSLKNKYFEFYNNDSLSVSMNFEDYYNMINGSGSNVYLIRDDSLYLFRVINYTHDIIENSSYGNIYEYYVSDLDA